MKGKAPQLKVSIEWKEIINLPHMKQEMGFAKYIICCDLLSFNLYIVEFTRYYRTQECRQGLQSEMMKPSTSNPGVNIT